jgi:F-type H+-transporting ATPase subunit b
MLQLNIADGALSGATGSLAPDGASHLLLVQETTPAPGTEAATGEAHTGEADALAHEGNPNAGMPQLNFADFAPQLVWLAITFILLLVLMWRVALPRIAGVIDERERRVQGDLDRAERLKAEADAALSAYQKTMADARAKAQAEAREAAAAIAAEASKRDAAFAAQLAERTKAAEASIAAAKSRALSDLSAVSAEVAGSVLAKVANITVPPAQLQAAVDSALKERG